MLSSIIEKSNKILAHISTIHEALLDILSLTQAHHRKKPPSNKIPNSPSRQSSSGSNKHSTHQAGTGLSNKNISTSSKSISISNKSTPQGSTRDMSRYSMKHSQSAGTIVMAGTPVLQDSMGDLDPAVEKAMLHFCETTLDIVQTMVLVSHEKYSSCLQSSWLISVNGSSLDLEEADDQKSDLVKASNRVVRFDVPDDFPDMAESLVELLKQDNEAMQDKLNFLRSTLSERLVIDSI